MPDVVVIIPARLASERLPRKMLLAETGKPLVQHTVERAMAADVGPVVVAADHQEIADALAPFGTEVVLTDPNHPSGTDRIAEVAADRGEPFVINVQGDEPEIDPKIIRDLSFRLDDSGAVMATVSVPYIGDVSDPNRVKVVTGTDDRALYFSRSPIPFSRGEPVEPRLHVGIYAYTRDFLLRYPTLEPTPLERAEKLEQLRVLEHGFRIDVLAADGHAAGIDTAEQYADFVQRFTSTKP
ncbi:MAG: 3-deoxy-manno-octulosonate cytidylyltransferase [Planctomycetota bacterium]